MSSSKNKAAYEMFNSAKARKPPCDKCVHPSTMQCVCDCHKQYEMVNNPSHYGGADDPFEHVKVAEAKDWVKDAFLYNATRYLWRLGLKPSNSEIQDLKKAIWYLQRKLSNLEGKTS